MRWVFGAIGVVAALGTAGSAWATPPTPIYSQPGDGEACNPRCWASSFPENGAGGAFGTYDDFTLSETADISAVTWQGFYYDYSGRQNPAPVSADFWGIAIAEDAGGLPGANLCLAGDTEVTAKFLGHSAFNRSFVDVYDFTARFAPGLVAQAGVTYWFSPLSIQTDGDPLFSWSASTITADGYAAQTSNPQGRPRNFYTVAGDRAFTIFGGGHGVPEPSAWSAILLGMGLVGYRLRRRPIQTLRA